MNTKTNTILKYTTSGWVVEGKPGFIKFDIEAFNRAKVNGYIFNQNGAIGYDRPYRLSITRDTRVTIYNQNDRATKFVILKGVPFKGVNKPVSHPKYFLYETVEEFLTNTNSTIYVP